MHAPVRRPLDDEGPHIVPPRLVDPTPGYAKVMNDVARSGHMNLQELGVYALVLGYSGPKGECWQPQEKLAEHVGVSVRMLQRHLASLVAKGFLSERIRQHGREHGELRGRSYAVSDAWRWIAESHDTGVARLAPQPESHTTPVSESHDTGVESHTTPVSPLKRTPVKDPEEDPETPAAAGDAVVADAPPPAAAADPPAKPSARRKTSEETDAPEPEDFELTPALFKHGASLGYDEARVRLELFACLDWFGSRKLKKANWTRTFRNWLTGEKKRDLEKAQAEGAGAYRGVHANGRARTAAEPQWTGKPGSPTSTDAREIARRTDWDL